MTPIKVVHFVTGGFSGATRVAIDLVGAHQKQPQIQTLLILRRKKTTTPDQLARLEQAGIPYRIVDNGLHLSTILQLKTVLQQERPDILVAHGFPEHLIGRWAGLLARVPHLVQVEHNSRERYTAFKRWQSRYLSQFTDLVITVSEGVRQVLVQQQLNAPLLAIPNGIDCNRFGAVVLPLQHRTHDLTMVGRFAKSKDQPTLIRALALLKARGVHCGLTLVGSGSRRYRHRCMQLAEQLGVQDQIRWIVHSNEVEQLLATHRVFVMSSNFEGLNLSVLEAMASGCVVIGSDAVGVAELIDHGQDGFVFHQGDAAQLADLLQRVVADVTAYQPLADRAAQKVRQHYSHPVVMQRYLDQFCQIASQPPRTTSRRSL